MCCGRKDPTPGLVTKYEVKTNDGKTTVVDDLAEVRRTVALGGGGSWKAVQVPKQTVT